MKWDGGMRFTLRRTMNVENYDEEEVESNKLERKERESNGAN